MKQILWVSCISWLNNGNYRFPINGPGAVSGSLFQQTIIQGLETLDVNIEILSDYPLKDRKFVLGFDWSHNGKSKDKVILSIRNRIFSLALKPLSIIIGTIKKTRAQKYDIVISYLVHTPYLLSLWVCKKVNKGIKTILICPDLPQYMDMSLGEKPIKRLLKKIDYSIISKLLNNVDAYVVFTEEMINELPIGNKPVCLIEGVFSSREMDFSKIKKKKAVLHAGTLHKNIGIENIVQAFSYIEDQELELWIFGEGELKDYIIRASRMDNRIKFFGFVSRSKLFEFEKQAMLLINARDPNDLYTKYSFPSKTFEYLVSGTPFLTTKLKGIPNEYYNYLYTMESNQPQVIAINIEKVIALSKEELETNCMKARNFVIAEKNWNVQSKKLFEFIENIRNT